jgi:hypothetical protein
MLLTQAWCGDFGIPSGFLAAFLVDNLAQTAIVPRLFLPLRHSVIWFMLI